MNSALASARAFFVKLRVCCKLNVLRTNEADVAQLVEQPIRNRQVTSSSLVVGSSSQRYPRHNLATHFSLN